MPRFDHLWREKLCTLTIGRTFTDEESPMIRLQHGALSRSRAKNPAICAHASLLTVSLLGHNGACATPQRALQETGISHAPSKVNAIFEYLKVEFGTRNWKKSVPKNLLPLRNGVFDTNTKTLHPHSPDYRFVSQLPHEYNPIATCEPIIDWLSQTQNGAPERIQLLRAYPIANGSPVSQWRTSFVQS
ncbi:MAG: hypothetical protein H7237_06315 [Alkalinema sp. FL-bin-369]|nr:hypothetical protein [Leptolyngbyaceae cyanobacterium LF-bin-369]